MATWTNKSNNKIESDSSCINNAGPDIEINEILIDHQCDKMIEVRR